MVKVSYLQSWPALRNWLPSIFSAASGVRQVAMGALGPACLPMASAAPAGIPVISTLPIFTVVSQRPGSGLMVLAATLSATEATLSFFAVTVSLLLQPASASAAASGAMTVKRIELSLVGYSRGATLSACR